MSEHTKDVSVRTLVYTLFALLFLAGLSLALRFAQLGNYGFPVALGIALVKAVLVGVFFMEILHEGPVVHLAMAAGFTLFALLLVLLVADVLTRTVPPLEPAPGNAYRDQG
jgi:cytochrome c oxidase subunit 4